MSCSSRIEVVEANLFSCNTCLFNSGEKMPDLLGFICLPPFLHKVSHKNTLSGMCIPDRAKRGHHSRNGTLNFPENQQI